MLQNRINRRTVLHGAITLTGTLVAVQLGSAKKAQGQSTSLSQRNRHLRKMLIPFYDWLSTGDR